MRNYHYEDIKNRCLEEARYLIDHKATVRQTAKACNSSKSTVHKDLTEQLWDIDPDLAAEAEMILKVNKAERHLRGGYATKRKYKLIKLAKVRKSASVRKK